MTATKETCRNEIARLEAELHLAAAGQPVNPAALELVLHFLRSAERRLSSQAALDSDRARRLARRYHDEHST